MAGQIPVADAAVAQVALTRLLEDVLASEKSTEPDAMTMAYKILAATSGVKFQPSTRRLVLSFDLAMSGDEGD